MLNKIGVAIGSLAMSFIIVGGAFLIGEGIFLKSCQITEIVLDAKEARKKKHG